MNEVYYTATDQRCKSSAVEEEIIARLIDLGVPVVPQVKLGQNWIFDGAITGTRVLVEIHGDYWHTRPEVQERDGRKQQWADQDGYTILTIWEADYSRDPDTALLTVVEHYEAVRTFAAQAIESEEGNTRNTRPAIRSEYGDWRDRFLIQLAETGIVLEACLAAGVSRKTAYQYRNSDPDFAADWKLALQDAADLALTTYRKRALQQSDRAMEFFIKSRDPETFGAPGQLELVMKYLDLSKLSDEQLDRIAAGHDPLQVVFGG